ncbi:tetratricopeptide repeat protein [Candidatus Peregrinibacteria bacterium]|nr:tetratricopeptide repeat protein [Candidatus Peregrinibacteria bacterium]
MKKYFSYIFLSSFFLFALLNPLFKKYDYGAGWPLVLLLAVGLGVIGIVEFKRKRERVHFEKLFLLIFMGFYLASFIFSETKNIGLSEVIAYLSAGLLYLLFAYQKIPWMEKFLKVVLYGTAIASVIGLGMYAFQPETRMFGPFFNIFHHANEWPNAFALYLLLTWPVFLIFTGKKNHYWIAVLLGIVFSALILTYSRGAMIAFAGQIVLILLYFVRKIKLKQVLATGLTVVITAGIFLGINFVKIQNDLRIEDVTERVTFDNTESLTSKQERVDFWIGAIELTKEKPLLGWGPFSFRQAYNGIQKTFLGNSDHPHNVFLKIAAENGIFALFGFIAFLLTVGFTTVSRFKTISKPKRQAAYVLSVGVLGAFAHSLIDYNFNFIVNLMLLFLFLAFIRSFFVKRDFKARKNYIGLICGILIAVFALSEGAIYALHQMQPDPYDATYNRFMPLKMSHYKRGFYTAVAEKYMEYDVAVQQVMVEVDMGERAIETLDKQIELNRLDSRAFYLKGVIYAKDGEFERAKSNFQKALQLNPMNEWSYYVDYLRLLLSSSDYAGAKSFIEQTMPLVDGYVLFYVENNVHFTAYTDNVEAVAEFIDLASPYIDRSYLTKKTVILETAELLRSERVQSEEEDEPVRSAN